MGNALSEEEVEAEFLEEGFNLDSPDADRVVNFGTAAPVWQNTEEIENDNNKDAGQEVALGGGEDGDNHTSNANLSHKHRRDSSNVSDGSLSEDRKRQHTTGAAANNNSNTAKKMSYVQMAKLGYQELINAIIRPPRADYKMEALGPPAFNFCGKRFTRTDFTLRTKRGYNLECSHWEPVERATDRIPVVIYMHGNSSARLEVIPQLSYLLSLGLAVFAFDFAGSGKSDGEYVSLGYYEREDLSCIVAHLRATNVVSTIALWGRSMGAATALMFGDRDPSIACMILDSSFADLSQLCEEMVEKAREQGVVVPGFVVSVALRMIQTSVKKQAGFNIKSISPITHVDKCFIPALFVAGEHDDFIKKHHSEELHAKYAGDKNLIIVEGDHNSPRPKFMFDSASIFLQTCLQIPNDWALATPTSMNLMCPPWYFELYEQRANRRKQQAAAKQRQQQQQQMNNGAAAAAAGVPPPPPPTVAVGVAVSNGDASSNVVPTGFDHEEMGMTTERQRVIQASLFKMLGQADEDEVDTSAGGGESAASKSASSS